MTYPPGTDNAINQLVDSGSKRLLNHVTPESPAQTAEVIVRATASRKDEIYFPYLSVKPMVLLHSLFPRVVDFVMRVASFRS